MVYSFTGTEGDGAFPVASVVIGTDGALYGTTQVGGSATSGSSCSYGGVAGCGIVFKLTPPTAPGAAWTETILHSFTGHNGDGATPLAGLVLSPAGVLYARPPPAGPQERHRLRPPAIEWGGLAGRPRGTQFVSCPSTENAR